MRKIQAAKKEKKYKEVADSLHWSGAVVDSDNEFKESGISVNFKFLSEIHGIMRGQPSVSPPALLDTSATVFRIHEERSSASTCALKHLSYWWSHCCC